MLNSLKGTGVQARLDSLTYASYQKEVAKIAKSWKNSLHYLKNCNFTFIGGITDNLIPTAYCQHDYFYILYDYRECRVLESGKSIPNNYKTMANNGTFPCAILMLLEHFGKSADLDLVTIGQDLVKNNYCTENSGTLWICMDNLLEKLYGIQTKIQSSIFELCESVSLGLPVLTLVPASWLHNYPMTSNECVIVWRLEGKIALVSSTSTHKVMKIDLYDLLEHIQRAWVCELK